MRRRIRRRAAEELGCPNTVVGLDKSEEAIATARRRFSADGIEFRCDDVNRIDELFAPHSFDVVVSLETFEHIPDPSGFLRALKRVAKPDAVVILSCPNDHWYYPAPDTANPFHVRKYAFEEFKSLTTEILGDSVRWLLGSWMVGFGSCLPDSGPPSFGQMAMVEGARHAEGVLLPTAPESEATPRNCSYFMGVWGAPEASGEAVAVYPVSMDEFTKYTTFEKVAADRDRYSAQAREAHELVASMSANYSARSRELAGERERFRIQALVLQHENDLMSARLSDLDAQAEALQKTVEIIPGLRQRMVELEKWIAEDGERLRNRDEQLDRLQRSLEHRLGSKVRSAMPVALKRLAAKLAYRLGF